MGTDKWARWSNEDLTAEKYASYRRFGVALNKGVAKLIDKIMKGDNDHHFYLEEVCQAFPTGLAQEDYFELIMWAKDVPGALESKTFRAISAGLVIKYSRARIDDTGHVIISLSSMVGEYGDSYDRSKKKAGDAIVNTSDL